MVLFASSYDQTKYFQAVDLERERKFRIKSVTVEQVGEEKRDKLVVWFTNDKRGLPLNRTNNRVIRGAFGDDTAGWKDKIVILFPMMVDFRGKLTPAVRVRIPPPKQAQAGNGATPVAKPTVAAPAPQPVVATAPAPQPQPAAVTASVPEPAVQVDDPELADDPRPTLSEELDDEVGF
jgi:hypothetical protein